ncbi:hypothetical protein H0H92_014452 [Tricholoma furcatifolium]|nr:hypothetical protein H0H92_014452 [Tricholoma furcatifolium]
MFSRQFTRLPLRRLIHTAHQRPASSFSRINVTLATSATVAAFLAYSISSNPIALDSASSEPRKVSTSTPINKTQKPASPEASAYDATSPEPTREPGDPTDAQTPAAEGESPADASGSGGAFNPVTGEINWDCPCLGGMAHGPCGPQFREAFSCFVFSEDEPKGINCVEKFKAMQNCFREHPEIYADEIDDDDEPASEPKEGDSPAVNDETVPKTTPPVSQTPPSTLLDEAPSEPASQTVSQGLDKQ